jgi:hypothetical protein
MLVMVGDRFWFIMTRAENRWGQERNTAAQKQAQSDRTTSHPSLRGKGPMKQTQDWATAMCNNDEHNKIGQPLCTTYVAVFRCITL